MTPVNPREHMDMELEKIEQKLLKLGKLAEDALSKAVWALRQKDDNLAVEVINGDDALDELADSIDEDCLRFMARFQPLGVDLRIVSSIIHMSIDLERIGDYGTNIAKFALRLSKEKLIKPLIDIPRMEATIREMVDKALLAFMNRDAALAEEVCNKDNEIDALEKQIFRELLILMMENPRNIEQATDLLFVARTLERAGDHVTNIAERIILIATGRRVRASELRRKPVEG